MCIDIVFQVNQFPEYSSRLRLVNQFLDFTIKSMWRINTMKPEQYGPMLQTTFLNVVLQMDFE